VYGWDNMVGTFTICVTELAAIQDEYTGAIELISYPDVLPLSVVASSNYGATQSIAPINCNGYTSPAPVKDVWFKFKAVSASHTIVPHHGANDASAFDMIVQILSPEMWSHVACDDNAGVPIHPITYGSFIIDNWYYIRVYGWDNSAGTFTLGVTHSLTIANECSAAITLTVGAAFVAGHNVGATGSISAITCGMYTSSNPVKDVWYKFTATSATHTVSVQHFDGFDMIVDIRSGTCAELSEKLFCGDLNGAGDFEVVATSLTVSNVYFVRVYGWDGATGGFNIKVY